MLALEVGGHDVKGVFKVNTHLLFIVEQTSQNELLNISDATLRFKVGEFRVDLRLEEQGTDEDGEGVLNDDLVLQDEERLGQCCREKLEHLLKQLLKVRIDHQLLPLNTLHNLEELLILGRSSGLCLTVLHH